MSTSHAVRAVDRLGGVARTRELTSLGVRGRDLAAAVRGSALLRPRQGLYVLPSTSGAVCEALSHGGLAACVTAARELGLWTLDDGHRELSHTWVDRARHPTRLAIDAEGRTSCCVFHRDSALDSPSRTRVGLVHCLVQLLGCRGPETFFAALESALRQNLLSDPQRDALRACVGREDRWLVDLARRDADSGLESLVRLRLHLLGISVLTQVAIPGVGLVDFVIGDCLIVEADGDTHEQTRHEDRVRDAAAAALGYVTLRFDYRMIVHDWPTVVAAILAGMTRGAHLHRSPDPSLVFEKTAR